MRLFFGKLKWDVMKYNILRHLLRWNLIAKPQAFAMFGTPWILLLNSTRGSTPCAMKICIIRCKYVEDSIGSTWAFYASNTKFCKRNFRTPAWVNNVIGLHGS
jgi:hypothetical protein